MSIAAIITEGIGPGGSIKYLLTGGLDIGAVLSPWTPVPPISETWTPTTESTDIWTPQGPASSNWTPQ